MFKLSQKSISHMMGIDPRLIQIARRAIEITNVDFGIPEDGGVRTAQRQHELYLMGRSKCDGYEKLSNHQIKSPNAYGKAVDFFAYKNGLASWDNHLLAVVACAFLQASCELGYIIQWGGLWRSWQDYPHIQLNEGFI